LPIRCSQAAGRQARGSDGQGIPARRDGCRHDPIGEPVAVALNGVGPHPLRAKKAEAALVGQALEAEAITAAAAAASEECEPFTDAIASEWYRRKMTGVYVSRALSQLAGEER